MAARKRSKGGRGNGRRGRQRGPVARLLRRGLLLAVVLAVVAGAGWTWWLNQRVVAEFENRQWALPADVYARPLELYQGRALDAEAFARELAAADYQRVREPKTPGSYSRNGATFEVHRRAFRFPDGRAGERRIRVTFDGGRVARLRDADGNALDLFRLDPARIGSVYPGQRADREPMALSDMPRSLVAALLAVEDRRFTEHFGISPLAILRAAVANIRAGEIVQGGSTLTQQLVKNLFLSNERTLWRKANEAVMAMLLEWHYDKRTILETYLNEVYLGQDGDRAIHGFGLASRFYFGKPLERTDLAEQALLVAMVKGPSWYDPRRHPERARKRRDLVLDVMAEGGFADADAVARARKQPLGVHESPPEARTAYPAFMDLVRRDLSRDYRREDLNSDGLRIFTTLAPSVQYAAEQAVIRRTRDWKDDTQAAAVVVGVDTGEVEAVVGGRDPRFPGFNRALDAARPIGSLVKPAVYLTALERPGQYGLGSVIRDRPVTVQGADGQTWTPRNYDRERHGDVPLWAALAHSYNVPTVRLGLNLGLRAVADTLSRLGGSLPDTVYPSLLLGAVSYTPLEVAGVYETIATGGYETPLRAVRTVMTRDGAVLSRYPLTVERTVERVPMYLLRRAMQRVVREGTGRGVQRWLGAGPGVAGKTGTTDDLRDSWFAGFSADRLGVVWVGRDDNGRTGLTGATGALTVWAELFAALPYKPLNPRMPDGIEQVWIDPDTGRLASADCPDAVQLPYARGAEPDERAACARRGDAVQRAGAWLRGLVD
ncbi:penicillin-binding protein 1B [Arhodomonas aquaeolei]|uniref:penicillin-binding protein 1B n=1 Tax=Arhodomonas aquaeolei TaxID=2369 RepID=UPI00036655AB|nr:penicillin-binding protein 1B [Arhodomonas aquaeolei]